MTSNDLLIATLGPANQASKALQAWLASTDLDHLPPGQFELLPLLFLRTEPLSLPSPLAERLRGIYRKAWYQHTTSLNAAGSLAQAFVSVGISPPVLLFNLSAGSVLRPRQMADFYIPSPAIFQALQIADSLGWRAANEEWRRSGFFTWRSNLVLSNQHSQHVKLHWHLLSEWPAAALDDACLQQTQAADIINGVQPSLAPTSALLLSLAGGTYSLPGLADAALILKSTNQIDWTWLCQAAASAHLSRNLYYALQMIQSQLNLPVSETALTALKPTRQRTQPPRFLKHWLRFRQIAAAQQQAPTPANFAVYLRITLRLPFRP